jgi:hypothetical protein
VSGPNLLRPSSLRVRIYVVVQTLNQFARQRCSLFIREAERLGQQLFGIQSRRVTRMDFDPRDYDSRDDERHADRPRRGGRGGSIDRDREYSRRGSESRILATVGAPDRESPGAAVMISQVTTGDALTRPARSLASAFAGATGDT